MTGELSNIRVVIGRPPNLPGGLLRIVDGDDVLVDVVREARSLAWALLNDVEGLPPEQPVRYVIDGRDYVGTVHDVVLLGAATTQAAGELDPGNRVSGRLEIDEWSDSATADVSDASRHAARCWTWSAMS